MGIGTALLFCVASANVDAGAEPLPPPVPVPADAPAEDAVDGGPAGRDDAEGAAEGIPGVTVSAKVEPDPVPFGGRFELVLSVVRGRGQHLEIPAQLGASEEVPQVGEARRTVQELPPPSHAGADAGTEGTDTGAVQAADAGPVEPRVWETLRVPFLALALEDTSTPAFVLTARDGATLEVPALPVRVADDPSLLAIPDAGPNAPPQEPGSVQLEPASAALSFRVPDPRPWAVAAALGSALLAFVAVRAAQKRRRLNAPPPPPVPLAPPRPPHEVALERLEALLSSGLLSRGETGVFVERLMDEVLRDYLAARFSLHAEARTTRELVAELLSVSVPGLDVKLVEELLGDADLVKFAKAAIAAERAHAMALRVKMLVLATAPSANAPSANAPAASAPAASAPRGGP